MQEQEYLYPHSKKNVPNAEVTAFEKDLLTGKILSHLHPQDKIRIEGYEKMEGRYSQYFDVIASNIPFGDVAVFDPLLSKHETPAVSQSTKAIHNYFFTKSVMAAREGGLIAFITSQGVLNSEQNKPIREHLMNSCHVVSTIRLSNNLFTEEAGTEFFDFVDAYQDSYMRNSSTVKSIKSAKNDAFTSICKILDKHYDRKIYNKYNLIGKKISSLTLIYPY
ncbi:N-6 DNA methylase [Dysgonomonas sp. HGC4]|uniref:N-6 DNA methylase n=1 Tax=Dysgonomonas sp. HGC4 TaxID=1658009 RepID=UPI00068209E8|nr:N-6 DNA methylase [Dysgonomonas sp. HGC4]